MDNIATLKIGKNPIKNPIITCVTQKGNVFIVDETEQIFNIFHDYYNHKRKIEKMEEKEQEIMGIQNEYIRTEKLNILIGYQIMSLLSFLQKNKINKLVIGQKKHSMKKYFSCFYILKEKLLEIKKNTNIEFLFVPEDNCSVSSFIDNDKLPLFKEGQSIKFSGTKSRYVYRSKKGINVTPEINSCLNLFRRCMIVSEDVITQLRKIFSRWSVDGL